MHRTFKKRSNMNRRLVKEIYGSYPYWISQDEYINFRYDLLTTIGWFDISSDYNGNLVKRTGYPPTKFINYAHDKGIKVIIVYTLRDDTIIDTILANQHNEQTTLINNLLNDVQTNKFNGIDINIEGTDQINSITGTPNRDLMTNFITNVSRKFWKTNSYYKVSFDIPGVDSKGIWDLTILQSKVNYIKMAGYNYHWKGSEYAGPNAPIDVNYPDKYSIRKSIENYGSQMSKSKLILAVPYYGYEWPTVDNVRHAKTTGIATTFKYKDMIDIPNIYGRIWDDIWKTPWYTYQVDSQWYEGHYDDIQSLGIKYDLVKSEKLAGIAIWALGFDSGRTELWSLIKNRLYRES